MIKSLFAVILLMSQIAFAQAPSAPPTKPPPVDPNASTAIGSDDEAVYNMAPQVEYVYDPTGKKDPFKPYKAPRIRGDNRPSAPIDPLSVLEVGQLRLIAVLWNTSKPRAVVKDSQNKSYILFKNMRIGRNEGVVVDIREGEIVIVEKFDDGFGNTVREAKILEISSPDQAAPTAGG